MKKEILDKGENSLTKGVNMNKVEINENLFKKIIDGCKHSVATDDSRPVMKYIQLKIKNNSIIAYSVDGYRASRITAQLKDNYGEFVCYIKPINFKTSKQGTNNIVIEKENDFVNVNIITEYGKQRFSFNQKNIGEFIDIDKVFENTKDYDIKKSFNARYIKEAAKAIESCTVDVNRNMTLYIKENPTQPVIIETEYEGFKNEQLVLPVVLRNKT